VRRRTLTVCAARAFVQAEGAESPTMIGTLMALTRREPAKPQTGACIAGQ
jgi:hypothetical protein